MILPAAYHLAIHMTEERKRAASKRMQEIVRPLADKWHGTEEGLKWHKNHASKMQFGIWDLEKQKCDHCLSDFTPSVHHERFCSNKCKSAWRRKEGLDDITLKCEKCNREFRKNKYAKQRFCSRKCGSGRRKS